MMNFLRRFISVLSLLLVLTMHMEMSNALRTTTTTTSTKNPNYIGCYADSVARRDLYSVQGQWSKMTVGACISNCSYAGYLYAGLQSGSTCYCGNYYGLYGPLDESSCNFTCSGNTNCGGPLTNSVYKTNVRNWVPSKDNYIGCYQDWVKRDLNGYFYQANVLTVDSCVTTCTAANYTYAGVQAGNLCFCGDSFGKYGNKTYDMQCNVTCIGNPYQRCGGNMMSNIYSTGITKSKFLQQFILFFILFFECSF